MLAGVLAAIVLAATTSPGLPTPAASPTPYKPLAVPSPGATPWGPLSLAGVTLGDTADAVRARLGEPSLENQKPEIMILTYAMDEKHVTLSVFITHGRVTSLSAALTGGAKQSKFTDPFGLHLGDGVDTMQSARGQPSDQTENRNTYAVGPGFDWVYQFDHGIAASILVEETMPLRGPLPKPKGVSGNDGLSLEKPIRFKVANQQQATLYEDVFLAQFCDGKGTWIPTDRAMMAHPGTIVSVQGVKCSTTLRTLRYYFDRSHLSAH